MATFILATRNRHKVAEIQAVLGAGHRYRTLDDLPEAPAVVEDADTFAGNACKKAAELADWIRDGHRLPPEPGPVWVLADDSGLEVVALNGAPGVHSARFAAAATGATGNSTDAANNARLLRLLEGMPAAQRTARFRCVIALTPLVTNGPGPMAPRIFEGTCEGRILEAARGQAGFGYDPLFQPDGCTETFAELGGDLKNRISHRALALARLAAWLAS